MSKIFFDPFPVAQVFRNGFLLSHGGPGAYMGEYCFHLINNNSRANTPSHSYTGGGKQRPAMVLLDTGDDDLIVARVTTQRHTSEFDAAIQNWSEAGYWRYRR